MAKKKTEKTLGPVPEPIAMLDNGLTPMYMFDEGTDTEKMIYKIINETGEQIFYCLAQDKVSGSYKKNATTYRFTNFTPSVFKVVNNIAGFSIHKMEDLEDTSALGASELSSRCRFSLPKLPRELVDEIDAFFRHIDDKLGTEAIIMLTYDKTKEGDDRSLGLGWSYVVPKQANTGATCDYEPSSVIDILGDDEVVVGSMHSHPGMSAFCSGTDKSDQAHFDGLHVTFGWAEKKEDDPSETKFHAELQMGGKAWSLKPEQIFHGRTFDDDYDFDNIVKERVTKKDLTTGKGKWGSFTGYENYTYYDLDGNTPDKGTKVKKGKNIRKIYEPVKPKKEIDKTVAPEILEDVDFSAPNSILILAPLDKHEDIDYCIACDSKVTEAMQTNYRCFNCLSYFHGVDKKIEDILLARAKHTHLVKAGLSMQEDQLQDVWYWVEEMDDTNSKKPEIIYVVDKIHEGVAKTSKTKTKGTK